MQQFWFDKPDTEPNLVVLLDRHDTICRYVLTLQIRLPIGHGHSPYIFGHFPTNLGIVGEFVPKHFHQPDACDAEERAQSEEIDEPHHADVDDYLVAGRGAAGAGGLESLEPPVSYAVHRPRPVQLQNA